MNDAHDRFLQAVRAFQRAEEPARKDWADVDEKAFRRVIIDLDAAISELDPLSEGRATSRPEHTCPRLWFLSYRAIRESTLPFARLTPRTDSPIPLPA